MLVLPSLASGGAERVILTLAQHLDPGEFETSLIVIDGSGPLRTDVPASVKLIDLGKRRVLRALPALIRRVRAERADIVMCTVTHLNLAMSLCRPFLPAAIRLVGRETVVLSTALEDFRWSAIWRLAIRWAYRRLDAIVCQSTDMKSDLERHFGIAPDRLVLLPNPIDRGRARSLAGSATELGPLSERDPAHGPHFLGVGRLVEQKGFDLAIAAIAACRHERATLTIVGDGPLRGTLEAQACALGLAHRVHFAGQRRNPFPFYRAADAYIMSSRFEGLSNTTIEALSCGTPVLALPAPGGTLDLLSGVPGCRIGSDVSVEAMVRLLDGWTERQEVPAQATDRFDAPAVAAAYAAVLAGRHS